MPFARYEFGNRQSSLDPRLARWKQIHGVKIAEVTQPGQECGEVDGLWTRTPNQPVAVVTADCVPILLMNERRQAVAALHAGWRGSLQRIVFSFFQSLPEAFRQGEEWKAVIGPSIRSCCYEVSEDLIRQFKIEFPEIPSEKIEPTHRKLDLVEVNLYQLFSLGLFEVAIHPDCTYCKTNQAGQHPYYSYRRGDRDCRMFSKIEF